MEWSRGHKMAACWVLASDKFWFSSVFKKKKKKSHSKIRTLHSSPDSWLLWPHGAAFPYGVTARSQAASFRGSKRSLGSRPLWPSLTWHRHKHLNPVFFTHLPYLPGPCTHLRFYSMKLKDRSYFIFQLAAYFGTFTVQLLKGETLVNIQVKQKPFMITWVTNF